MESTPLFDRRVYAQDTSPSDERDGVLWVDTSEDSRPLYVYSDTTESWEITSPDNISIQDTEPEGPSLGDGWIDTSNDPPTFKVYDGAGWEGHPNSTEFNNHASNADAHHSRPSATNPAKMSGGYVRSNGYDWWNGDTGTSSDRGWIAAGETEVKTVTGEIPVSDGVKFHLDTDSSNLELNKFGVLYADGTEEWLLTGGFGTNQWYERTFADSEVEGWKVEATNTDTTSHNLYFNEIRPHEVTLPEHSHSI